MRAVHAELADMHDRGTERSRKRLHDLEQFNAAAKAAEAARDAARSAIAARASDNERRFFMAAGLAFTAAGLLIGFLT